MNQVNILSLRLFVVRCVSYKYIQIVEWLSVHDVEFDFDEIIHAGLDHIAVAHTRDARRRACEYDIAILEREVLAHVLDEEGQLEDHVARVAVLFDDAVDGQAQLEVVHVAHALLGHERADGQRGVEAFGEQPRMALLLELVLDATRRHVEREHVAEHVAHRVLARYVLALLADDHAELELVVERLEAARYLDARALDDDRTGRLAEYDRLAHWHLIAQFFGVLASKQQQ